MRRLLIGDRRMRVRDEGESRKRLPAVLVHGAGSSSVVWMDVLKRLAVRRRVVAPDLPGHGQSDPWQGISIELYRDAVGTMCAQLQLEKVVLVGHSMGGAVALACALAWPERVAALVLVATAGQMEIPPPVMAALERDPAGAPALLAPLSYSPSTAREIVERWTAVAWTAPAETLLGDFQACNYFDVVSQLKQIKVPVLVLGGEDDLMVPPLRLRELCAALVNARAVLLPHAGHLPFHERPDEFHVAVDSFLREVA